MRLDGSTIVGVVGAGAMGAGIAQVAALRGHRVVIADASSDAIERARQGHARAMVREVEKGRCTRTEADAILGRISYVPEMQEEALHAFADCGLVIEAIVEELGVKRELLRALELVIDPEAVLATNTSSLSIAALAGGRAHPGRILGIHFFNPAPVMPLVEIIPSIVTDPARTAAARALVDGWGKSTVLAQDTPGFIVNRVARPFYGESLRILEEGVADAATIDWAMRTFGPFRMGPFELMDFIGNDVNYAVTRSVFEGMSYDPRYTPSLTQRRLVEAGWLGRKTGRGYYDYGDQASAPNPMADPTLGQAIVDRVLAMLVNEAAEALHRRIATPEDLERAMTAGVSYPKGLLAWGDEIGAATILARLEALQAEYGEDRYRPSPYLRRVVRSGGTLRHGVA